MQSIDLEFVPRGTYAHIYDVQLTYPSQQSNVIQSARLNTSDTGLVREPSIIVIEESWDNWWRFVKYTIIGKIR